MKLAPLFLSVVVLLCCSLQVRAQQNPAAIPARRVGQLTGTVRDAAGQPVPFPTVTLLSEALKQQVAGAVGDGSGQFVVPGLGAGRYALHVSAVGYQPLTEAGLEITSAGETLTRHPVLTAAPTALGEVVVQGQRTLVEEQFDRTVYHAEQDHTTQGGTAVDVLRHVPLLSVDLDGDIRLRGSTSLKVLVNGKPSTITAGNVAEALRQLPADQIKTVEVITAPSAKYDAEGASGVINLITKQDRLAGKQLDARLGAGLRTASLALNGSYRTGKMGFSLGGGLYGGYNTPGAYTNTQRTTDPRTGTQALTVQQAAQNRQQLTGRYSFGWDYDLDSLNSLTATAQWSVYNFSYQQLHFLTETYRRDTLLRRSLREVDQRNNSTTLDLGLTYTHLFRQPRHELSVLGLYSRNNARDAFTSTLLDPAAEVVTGRLQNDNPSSNQEVTVQLDYQRPLGQQQLLELGGKSILRQVRSDYAYLAASSPDGAFQPLLGGLTNAFAYQQHVSAAYLSYSLNLGPAYTLRAGARYEYTTIGASFATGQSLVIPDYGVLVPSLALSRKLANGNLLKASFNRRLQRPSLHFLNPNLQASNPLDVSQGNPLLAPEYTNNYELAYNTGWKNATVSLSGFARTTTGVIEGLLTTRGDTVYTTFANIGRSNAYGLNGNFTWPLGDKLKLVGNLDLFYVQLTNNVTDVRYQASNRGWVANGRLTGSYAFTPKWNLQAFGYVRGREVQLQGYVGPIPITGLSLKYSPSAKASVSLSVDNFVPTTVRVPTSYASPVLTQYAVDTRQLFGFRVNFSYHLGKLEVPRARKQVQNDDTK